MVEIFSKDQKLHLEALRKALQVKTYSTRWAQASPKWYNLHQKNQKGPIREGN